MNNVPLTLTKLNSQLYDCLELAHIIFPAWSLGSSAMGLDKEV